MYLVVDTVSRNVLGECDSKPRAKALFLELVASHPEAYRDIQILSEGGTKSVTVPEDEVLAALGAVVTTAN